MALADSDQQTRRENWRFGFPVLAYLLWLALAEALTTLFFQQRALWLHGGLVVALLLHWTLEDSRPLARVWLALAFAPLIRLVSLVVPLAEMPLVFWYLLTGVPLFLALWAAMRLLRTPTRLILEFLEPSGLQLAIGLTGLVFGFVEYLILRPDPLVHLEDPWAVFQSVFVLLVFTGALEEIIFRGLMQMALARVLGGAGILYVAAVFTILHLGYRSALDLIFVFGVALFFGFAVHKTRSLVGVSLSHGLTNIGLFLIFPVLVGGVSSSPRTTAPRSLGPARLAATPGPRLTVAPTAEPTSREGVVGNSRLSEEKLTAGAVGPIHRPASPTVLPTIVVDDGEPGASAQDGQWWAEPVGYGGDLHWAFAVPEVPSTVLRWTATIPTCGLYRIEAYVPERYPSSRNARYEIEHVSGHDQVPVDQSANQGRWVDLGIYTLSPEMPGSVTLTNATGETEPGLIVTFDAVRWSLQRLCDETGTQAISPAP